MSEGYLAGVLGQAAILNGISNRNIVIAPFNMLQLQTSSYDVALGSHYFREGGTDKLLTVSCGVNIHMKTKMWNQIPFRALSMEEAIAQFVTHTGHKLTDIIAINDDPIDTLNDKYIILAPGENILAHTEEFIGTTKGSHLTASCHTKSTIGRTNILTCKCAGWGDVGYYNRWTLEITNNSKSYVMLKQGSLIAQIAFWTVKGSSANDSYSKNGSYQKGEDLQSVINNWNPKMMLPKESNN